MHPTRAVPPALLAIAARQGGVLTRAQALSGVGRTPLRRLLASGIWVSLTPGIIATTPHPSADARLWAGHLLGGPDSALAGLAALHLAGVAAEPDLVEVWVPNGRRRTDRPGWAFRQDGLGRLDHTLGTLPRIRTEEALLDVGATLDVEGWVSLLAEALRLDKVSLPGVLQRLDARTKLTQRSLLREVVRDMQGIQSTLEWVYRRDVERAHQLPPGLRQASVAKPWQCDVHYEEWELIVEVDGRYHAKRELRDLERDNAHAVRRATTLRYGSIDLRGRPCRSAWQVALALQVRGWAGSPAPCPRCPDATERARWLVSG